MGNEIIATATAGVQVSLPGNLPEPIVLALVGEGVKELVALGYNVKGAIAEMRNNTQCMISFYEERSRVFCEYTVPITAMYAAHQAGVKLIKSFHLEPDLQQQAFADLTKSLNKQRQFL